MTAGRAFEDAQTSLPMITRHVDEVSGILIHRVVGAITLEELVDYTRAYLSEDPPLLVLWDASKAGRLDFSTQDLRTLLLNAKEAARKRGGGRTALLFSELSAFGLGRMLEVLAEVVDFPVEIRSFRKPDLAKKWLFSGDDGHLSRESDSGAA